MKQYNIAIVGSGIIGMTCALHLSKLNNIQITLYGKFPKHSEFKTTAILKTSFNLLKQIIDINENDATIQKLKKFKIIDQISKRQKILDFDSSELDIDSFAYNIKDSVLSEKLINQIKKSKNIIHVNEFIRSINTNLQEAIIDYDGNKNYHDLVIAADGRNSIIRKQNQLSVERIKYKENILITKITHSKHHKNTSYEIHRNGSLLTSVPIEDNMSAIVYIDRPETISKKSVKSLDDYFNELLGSYLGNIETDENHDVFPSETIRVNKLFANRCILIGESAHVIPPIGAQGLNLGLRDIEAIHSLLDKNKNINPGSKIITSKYNHLRWSDIYKRYKSVNLLYQSMMNYNFKNSIIRNLGIISLQKSKMIRNILLHEGMVLKN